MPPTDLFWQTYRPLEGFYTSEVATPASMPVRTFVPTGYEPNYAYPLIVWFHGQSSSEEQIMRLAPRLSRRNFICIGLRGPQLSVHADGRLAFSWSRQNSFDSLVEDYLFNAIEQTCRCYHIHPQRIYLAGVCEGATIAYRLGMLFPDRFAGIISLNGTMPRGGTPMLRLPQARRLRVFIGHGIANAYVPLTMARQNYRLLYTAGLDVEFRTYPANHRLHNDMLRDINQWIIGGIVAQQTATAR
ncbi:MAG: hypothetical protein KatS3mg105_1852 [Gemmatales bacterium]|nr:MAG: hypothetical protein KatS3mg105_1852 [Gemmatales bacterium]